MILGESSRGLQTWCKIGICIKSAKKSAEFTAKNAIMNQIYMQLLQNNNFCNSDHVNTHRGPENLKKSRQKNS